MKYADLIQFEPIETVVQLREADKQSEAESLVKSFVVSKGMHDLLKDIVFPQIQFDEDKDNKGVLAVGNYGTGKSHLMAVISAIAEHQSLADLLTDQSLIPAARKIAGRFKVIRSEIGATTMSLRDIVCRILQDGLAYMDVEFKFPEVNERHENKSSLTEMMAAFQAAFPDHGLLLVLDELLDYLRSRKDQESVLDLAFLREIGEFCNGTRFRFLSGVQESLFDNPRFQFVAEPLRRVQARFEQVRIARDDVAFVVARRILKKTATQEADIRKHLSQFGSLYGSLTERVDEFVRLFPVHPAYLEKFERVAVAEKREVLKTLSVAIGKILNDSVPADQPGLICYDSYWSNLTSNPSFRTNPDIKEVIERSTVLEDRLKQALTNPVFKPTALRIIHALSVQRLTQSDIYVPIGPTAEELRDDLCLVLPTPVKEAEFLKSLVEAVLTEMVKTVSGQFISHNKANGQYYLDLKKDIDFDALIERRGETVDNATLDKYYFDAMKRHALEDPETPAHVPGYRIWEHELEWTERKTGRSGYLFFGAPNERSTAQPPRDYYLYFLQVFAPPIFSKENKADEVFFKLTKRDEIFEGALKRYAGACELKVDASSGNKAIYQSKANDHLKTLTNWLLAHLPTATEVTYQGKSKTLQATVQGKLPATPTIRDYVLTAGSALLSDHFATIAPKYPVFGVRITNQNRAQAAQEALRWISGTIKSKQGAAVLDALNLLEGEDLRPGNSEYAQSVLALLNAKQPGQVLNRSEMIEGKVGVDVWKEFSLEPEFLAVVLAALAQAGELVITLPGKKIDAASVEQFAKLPIQDIIDFKHVERPKDLPIAPLKDLCGLLAVAPGLIVDPAHREEAVSQMQAKIADFITRLVTIDAKLENVLFWQNTIGTAEEKADWRKRLSGMKSFLEGIQSFNTAGKLKNFPHDSAAVTGQKQAKDLLRQIEALVALLDRVTPLTEYLSKAELVLPNEHAWRPKVVALRNELRGFIDDPAKRISSSFETTLFNALNGAKSEYQSAYMALHKAARLNAAGEKGKNALVRDDRWAQLRPLIGVGVTSAPELRNLENQLHALKVCYAVTTAELNSAPVCPHCQYHPKDEPAELDATKRLSDVGGALGTMVATWTKKLIDELADPSVKATIALLSNPAGKADVEAFIKSGTLPKPVPNSFVTALKEVFDGLQSVAVKRSDLDAALTEGGLPCTVEALKERFDAYVQTITKGKDLSKVRIVIE